MKLKEKYDFFTRCQTPELASEITVMPIDQIGTDAAILFSDILVVPQAMGVDVQMNPDLGPWLPNPIRNQADVDKVETPDIQDRLHYVMDAIKQTLKRLDNRVPLIGFAGAPWTVFCYMIQGQGSKSFDKAKAFCFSEPESARQLLQKITDTTINYLRAKHKAGVHTVQLFDSWGGVLSPDDYTAFSWNYSKQIIDALGDEIPVILFAKGCWYALHDMVQSKVKALGVDWTCTARNARYLTGGQMTLQGNFDPARLLSPIPEIQKRTREMIEQFGTTNYIANLGHGILPNIPVDHAKAFVDTIKSYEPRRY
ncbi:MAG: uroporphyrinogen decarboxylase [Flavobacteriaceae bacterium]|nr:uroporphyrinogen decarboxylase [Flavobacteriaceae bacterium]